MSENTNECVIEWIPGRDYVGLTAKNGSTWKNRCEELEGYVGVQTFMWICEDNIVEVPFDKEHLLERIISPDIDKTEISSAVSIPVTKTCFSLPESIRRRAAFKRLPPTASTVTEIKRRSTSPTTDAYKFVSVSTTRGAE